MGRSRPQRDNLFETGRSLANVFKKNKEFWRSVRRWHERAPPRLGKAMGSPLVGWKKQLRPPGAARCGPGACPVGDPSGAVPGSLGGFRGRVKSFAPPTPSSPCLSRQGERGLIHRLFSKSFKFFMEGL